MVCRAVTGLWLNFQIMLWSSVMLPASLGSSGKSNKTWAYHLQTQSMKSGTQLQLTPHCPHRDYPNPCPHAQNRPVFRTILSTLNKHMALQNKLKKRISTFKPFLFCSGLRIHMYTWDISTYLCTIVAILV